MSLCISPNLRSYCIIYGMFRYRRTIKKMENYHSWLNHRRCWRIRSSNLWTWEKCLLVWISTWHWENKKNGSKANCNWTSSYFCYFSWYGLGNVESRQRNSLTWPNGLQEMFISSENVYWTSEWILHRLDSIEKSTNRIRCKELWFDWSMAV